MAIRIDKLDTLSKVIEQKRHLYKDVFLDIKKKTQFSSVTESRVDQNDITVLYDKDAIFTSLRNLFTTKPGERFLFPKYGLDLRKYIFQPINQATAQAIGSQITKAIKDFEPRVELEQCNIIGKPDDNTYEIDVIVKLPVFNTVSTISSVLDVKTEKFTFIK